MCGITGISGAFSFSINKDTLRASLRAISHRGPDSFGVYEDANHAIGLTHARLSILDPSPLGNQPMHSKDGNVVLVFNGEIYNFRELRFDLEARGIVFRGNSDTEVLLNLYLYEGDAMLSKLNGIFSFAIWDKRKQELLVARDALGVKPLYYSQSNNYFAFASEIKALLHLAPDSKSLDLVSLHRYLSFLWCPGEGTMLKDVRKLGPGEAMWVKAGRVNKHWKWYQLPITKGMPSELSMTSSIDGVEFHLRQAVQRQMVADVPVGAFLSGGVDSSSIVAFAREMNPDIHCFTIESVGGQDDGFIDDLPYARLAAKHLGVSLDVISVDSSRMAADLERMVFQLDEPLADPATLNVLYISQVARDRGIKVLLSGAGGDDLFTGYRRHRALQAERYWSWMPLQIRHGLSQFGNGLDQRRSIGRRIAKMFSGASLEGNERLIQYFNWGNEGALLSLYAPEVREAIGSELAAKPMLDFLQSLPTDMRALNKMLAIDQQFFLADHNLAYTDKMSMAAGVEVRVPFLDLDLVNFASKIPLKFKQRKGEGKWVLKKAMEPYLPHEVIYRPKSGFGAPLRRWLKHDWRELVGDLLSTGSIKRRGLFNPVAVHQLISQNDAGKIDASYTLLSLLCIEIWCRNYLD